MNASGKLSSILESAVFCRTPAYNAMYRRPYNLNVSGPVVQEMYQNSGIQNGVQYSKFTPNALCSSAAQLLVPQTQYESEAKIVNGWGAERCMFMLRIVHGSSQNGTLKYVQYLTGFTDYMPYHQGHNGIAGVGGITIDPSVRLFFNSSIVLTEYVTTDPYGREHVQVQQMQASQLLMGSVGDSAYGMGDYTLRPEDIYAKLSFSTAVKMANDYNTDRGIASDPTQSGMVADFDSRTTFMPGQPYKVSKYANLVPSRYMSGLIESNRDVLVQFGGVAPLTDTASEAQRSLIEGYVGNTLTLDNMLQRTGLKENQSITFHELAAFFPNVLSVIQLLGGMSGRVEGAYGMGGGLGEVEYQNGAGFDVVIANMVANVSKALMIGAHLNVINFTATNAAPTDYAAGVVGGTFDVKVLWATSFIRGYDNPMMYEQFKQQLLLEFLNGYTGHNYVPLSINAKIAFQGESVVEVSYNNGPMTRYVFPVFNDAAYANVLTAQPNVLASMAQGLNTLNQTLFNQ